tara:strand:- start:1324 stop:1584 length:261 start_codon:yes stop_codon:yes gene_type:complete
MGSRTNLTKKDVNRSTVSPSKFTGLSALLQIQKDHYMGANGLDYDAEEVDRLIRDKQSRKAEKLNNELEKQQDEYQAYLDKCAKEL